MNESAAPYPTSLCHRCAALKLVPAARSTFMMCTALSNKYPRQPVMQCQGFVEKTSAANRQNRT